ncbi:U3 snoRNP protein [Tieghemostelium lacteum]|uniref:U3 small nucleolar RNA-associated protein 11 n=1 Tax=Tieghemostelium lacteum TaxID=361077 RepID=A0A151Z8J3_TIELA|nr:U3 snoRNP protein [Tieghemostelium lacteum]|eukprot:KYQ90261.1 U3 snoRNP protein [Tieghemostelium lacteum]
MSLNVKRLLPNKEKRERPQPARTLKLGFMERKKDYVQRAKDYNKKKEVLRKLKLQASLKNPDEFNFKMISSKLVNGVHKKISKTKLGKDEILDIHTQDLLYLQSKRISEDKKIDRLQSELQYIDAGIPMGEQVIFVDNDKEVEEFDAVKYYDTIPEAFTENMTTIPKLSKLKTTSIVPNQKNQPGLGTLEAMTTESYKELEQRKQRRDKLFEMEQQLHHKKVDVKKNEKHYIKKSNGTLTNRQLRKK